MPQKPRATFAQLSSSVCDGVTVAYSYDAAGRLIRAGELSYRYNAGGRVSEVLRNGTVIASFTYHPSGQLATVTRDGKTESYKWNGLSLDSRNGVEFLNEPSITGGNPAGDSSGRVYYNDRLGNTLAIIDGDMVELVETTAFGEPLNAAAEQAFFTGKPYIKELGYFFLMRNYRPELGRWQTSDPKGYPDGWNNFAYCNNWVTEYIDRIGFDIYAAIDTEAVNRAGHALGIATYQKAYGGWIAIGFSYASSDYSIYYGDGATENDALQNFFQKNDKTQRYDSLTRWEADTEQSIAARDSMAQEVLKEYDATEHNCLDILKAARSAAGIAIEEGNVFQPSRALEIWRNGGNFNSVLERIQSTYKKE